MGAITSSTAVDFKKVLMASDFSDESERALSYAKSIVHASGGELLLVHVSEPMAYIATPESTWFEDAEAPQREYQDTLGLRDSLHAEGFQATAFCPFGDVSYEIESIAKRRHADLVVVGTHARHGLPRLLFGSHAEALTQYLAIPVLIIGPGSPEGAPADWMPQRILCVVTPDEAGLDLVQDAVSLANQKHAHLQLLCSVPPSGAPEWFEHLHQEAMRYVSAEAVVQPVLPLGESDIEGLVTMARDTRQDLIVIAAKHGLFELPSLLGKGMLSRLLADAPCPVLVFPGLKLQ